MPGMNMFPSGSTLQIPLDACTNFSGEAGNAQVTLTWTDPKDKYATPEGETAQDPDQLVSVWEYTQIIRKTGSQPTGPHDGELVVSSSVRDQYATTGFVDNGLTNDTLYYYAAYAYNTDGVASEGAFTSATPMAGTPLGSLAEGTLIKIQENGAPMEFYLAKHNYEPGLNGEGRELVVRKDCYDQRQWNNIAQSSWDNSTMLSWLNSSYKTLFSQQVQSLMGSTNYQYTPGNENYTVSTRSDSIFLLSVTELAKSASYANVEGSPLSIASILQIAIYSGLASSQWTRTPTINTTHNAALSLNTTGNVANDSVTATYGSRPCFTLPSTARVDQDLNLIETAVQTTALSAA